MIEHSLGPQSMDVQPKLGATGEEIAASEAGSAGASAAVKVGFRAFVSKLRPVSTGASELAQPSALKFYLPRLQVDFFKSVPYAPTLDDMVRT